MRMKGGAFHSLTVLPKKVSYLQDPLMSFEWGNNKTSTVFKGEVMYLLHLGWIRMETLGMSRNREGAENNEICWNNVVKVKAVVLIIKRKQNRAIWSYQLAIAGRREPLGQYIFMILKFS